MTLSAFEQQLKIIDATGLSSPQIRKELAYHKKSFEKEYSPKKIINKAIGKVISPPNHKN
jgi:hypothetical protein